MVDRVVRHGTAGGYQKGCRCDLCREAHRVAQVEVRRRRRERPIPDTVAHGKYSTLRNYGCTCEPCRTANAAQHRKWRADQKLKRQQQTLS